MLLGDRAFCSFSHLALLAAMSVDAVFRMHQKQTIDFTPGRPHRGKQTKTSIRGIPTSRFVRRLGDEDQIVEWTKPAHRPVWMTDAQFLAATRGTASKGTAVPNHGQRNAHPSGDDRHHAAGSDAISQAARLSGFTNFDGNRRPISAT